MIKRTLIASALLAAFASHTAIAADDSAELRKVIEQQQKVLKDLEKRLDQTEKRVEQTADAAEANAGAKSATTIGGYGELHYNNIHNNLDRSKDKKEMDFHRFVLFFGHEFSSNTRFFSEVELEHALSGEGKRGEVELEQAYVEHDFNGMLTGKAGVFLMPVGIINETHEPPAFYGVERNPVETNIIPSTWWEGGLLANIKAAPGLSFDTTVTSGLKVDKNFNIRGGRQKVSYAKADDLAYAGRVKYTAINGLELAAFALYQSDLTQGEGPDSASGLLLEAHGIYTIAGFTFKALYAQWDIGGEAAKVLGRDRQNGWYIEPSYRFNEEFGVFARYNDWDNDAGNSLATGKKQTNVGINYWLHENVVFKADYERQSGALDADGFNLGVGYQF